MKRLLLVLFAVVMTTAIWAVRVDRTPALITQSDGSQVTVIGFGDADFHWYTTTDGVLLYKEGTNFYVAAIDANGEMTSSGMLVHEASQRTDGEKALITKQDKIVFFNSQSQKMKRMRKVEPIGTGA